MKFTLLALLGLVAVQTIQIEDPILDEDQFLLIDGEEDTFDQ
jgi:hypothetical protein